MSSPMPSASPQLTPLKPSELASAVRCSIETRQPLFIWGAPGIGKSEIVAQVVGDLKRLLRDVRASQYDRVDLNGVPFVEEVGIGKTAKRKITRWALPEFFPSDPNSDDVIFWDELNAAPADVLAASYQLFRDRRLGSYVLPEKVFMLAAGNRDGDGGVTHRLPTPLRGRFVHVELVVDLEDWARWAVGIGKLHPIVVAYNRFRPENLHKFDKNARACPDPRRWEFVSKILDAPPASKRVEFAMIEGSVGHPVAIEFHAFAEMYRGLPSIDNVILNPTTAAVPSDPSVQYAVVSALAHRAKPANFGSVMQYISRLPIEYQTFFVKDAGNRDQLLTSLRPYTEWCVVNSNVAL